MIGEKLSAAKLTQNGVRTLSPMIKSIIEHDSSNIKRSLTEVISACQKSIVATKVLFRENGYEIDAYVEASITHCIILAVSKEWAEHGCLEIDWPEAIYSSMTSQGINIDQTGERFKTVSGENTAAHMLMVANINNAIISCPYVASASSVIGYTVKEISNEIKSYVSKLTFSHASPDDTAALNRTMKLIAASIFESILKAEVVAYERQVRSGKMDSDSKFDFEMAVRRTKTNLSEFFRAVYGTAESHI